jgi:hypothetical protein
MRNLERRIGVLEGYVGTRGGQTDDPDVWTAERVTAALADIRPSSTPPTPEERAAWRARETDDGFRAVLEELRKLPLRELEPRR